METVKECKREKKQQQQWQQQKVCQTPPPTPPHQQSLCLFSASVHGNCCLHVNDYEFFNGWLRKSYVFHLERTAWRTLFWQLPQGAWLQTHFQNMASTMMWRHVHVPTAGPTVLPHAEHRTLEEGLYYGIQVTPSGNRFCRSHWGTVLSFFRQRFCPSYWGHLVTPMLPKKTVITMSPSFSLSPFLYWNTAAISNMDYTKPKFKGSKW